MRRFSKVIINITEGGTVPWKCGKLGFPFWLKNTIGLCNFQNTPLSIKKQLLRGHKWCKRQHCWVKVPPRSSVCRARHKLRLVGSDYQVQSECLRSVLSQNSFRRIILQISNVFHSPGRRNISTRWNDKNLSAIKFWGNH